MTTFPSETSLQGDRIKFRLFPVQWNNAASVTDKTSFSVSSDELAAWSGAALSVPGVLPLLEARSQHDPRALFVPWR